MGGKEGVIMVDTAVDHDSSIWHQPPEPTACRGDGTA